MTIGDKNYTEQFLLGQLYAQALEAQGFSVALNQNIGPTAVTLRALGTGALDMYPEYLDVFNSAVAGYHRTFRSQVGAYGAAQRYAGAHGLALLTATPFSDTAGPWRDGRLRPGQPSPDPGRPRSDAVIDGRSGARRSFSR